METQFKDRCDAGRFLAEKLKHLANNPNVVILALPRGGVPVAFEIARELNVPLDIFIVRKLGVPIYEELAMGAIASGGVRVLNEDVIRKLGITKRMIDAATAEQHLELERREHQYRRDRPTLDVTGRIAVLVDDGLATGATMRAAVQALQRRNPARIVVAVPVGAAETCQEFEEEVDEVVCGKRPQNFGAVGAWYETFTQTTDEEVCELLDRTILEHS
jgi:putative phosphoribosyl transferase